MFVEDSGIISPGHLCLKEAGQFDNMCPLLYITTMEPKLSGALLIILRAGMDVPSADWTETRGLLLAVVSAAPFYSGLTYISFLPLPPQSTAVWTLEGGTRKSQFILLLPGVLPHRCQLNNNGQLNPAHESLYN